MRRGRNEQQREYKQPIDQTRRGQTNLFNVVKLHDHFTARINVLTVAHFAKLCNQKIVTSRLHSKKHKTIAKHKHKQVSFDLSVERGEDFYGFLCGDFLCSLVVLCVPRQQPTSVLDCIDETSLARCCLVTPRCSTDRECLTGEQRGRFFF
jgi:hypothetical protein